MDGNTEANTDHDKEAKIDFEYSYEDIVVMYETFNFVFFSTLTLLVKILFIAMLNSNHHKPHTTFWYLLFGREVVIHFKLYRILANYENLYTSSYFQWC
jgi:hypothetical protein